MKILVVGGGGREHAIVWKIAQSPKVDKIYCAPGNGGIAELAECVDIAATDIENMVKFAKDNAIDLVMVAPDDPLVLGMVDAMEKEGIRAFGPRANAAIIEGSKAFSKELMKKYNIPTANYEVFTDSASAIDYIKAQLATYDYIDENMPEWAIPTITKLVDKGFLKGDEEGKLGLTEDLMRLLVINDRAGLYDKKK